MKYLVSTIILFTIFFTSCEKGNNCFVYPGNKTTIKVSLSNFSSIKVNYLMDIEWHQSPTHYMVITAGENHIDQIEYKVENQILELSNNNKCEWLREKVKEVKIKVYSPTLEKLNFRNNGSFTTKDTIYNDFELDCFVNQGTINLLINNSNSNFSMESGGTDLNVSGYCSNAYLYNLGINHFNGFNFYTNDFHINNGSAGLNNLNVANTLLIEQNGTGDILYKGNPIITVSSYKGQGKIIAQ